MDKSFLRTTTEKAEPEGEFVTDLGVFCYKLAGDPSLNLVIKDNEILCEEWNYPIFIDDLPKNVPNVWNLKMVHKHGEEENETD